MSCDGCSSEYHVVDGYIEGKCLKDMCEKCCYCGRRLIKKYMAERKYLPTLSELIDRLSICQLKDVFIAEHKQEYAKEIEDIMHDIDVLLVEEHISGIKAETIRSIIVLAQMNLHIWHNESNFRKGIREGNNLELTHGLNGIRNTAKNKIQSILGGRMDYKVDNVEAFKEWIPSGWEGDE